ncbi:hypothetical protein, partial [Odoribacter laneus]|uniref:hypothetical protein n=1 Tax=Odoribacter laneus TaxID=626933 RepID=UPI0023F12A53
QSTIFPNHKSCVRKKGVPESERFLFYYFCILKVNNFAIQLKFGGMQENLFLNLTVWAGENVK